MTEEPNDQKPVEQSAPFDVGMLPTSQPELRPSIDLRPRVWPPWSGWHVLLLALLTLCFTVVGVAVAARLPYFRGMKITELAGEPRFIVPVQSAAYLVVFLCMVLIVRQVAGTRFWRTIEWKRPGVAGFGYLLGGIVLAIGIELLSAVLPTPKQLPIEKYFKDASGAYLMALFGISLAPLLEELFFRGFLYPVLARRVGMSWGVMITSILFAFIHASQLGRAWGPVLLLVIVGSVLTYVRARTGSVANAFLIHVGYNLTLFSLLWVQSDRFHNLQKALSAFVFNA